MPIERRPPTLKDIAAACGVSASAVSRVLNGYDSFNVRDETRATILETSRRLGYRANHAAANLRRQRTDIIAILGHGPLGPLRLNIADRIVMAAVRTFREQNYHTCIWYPPESRSGPSLTPSMMDGALLMQVSGQQGLIDRLEQLGVPYVAVNGVGGSRGQSIIYDDADGMEQAMTHLHGLGHRRIAYKALNADGVLGHYSVAARHNAYLACCDRLGLEPLPGHDVIQSTEAFLHQALEQRASAVILYHARLWPEFVPLCHRRGIRIPEDLSVLCFDDFSMADCMSPTPTVIATPDESTGLLAAELLLNVLKGNQPPLAEPAVLACHLVVRESTGPVG